MIKDGKVVRIDVAQGLSTGIGVVLDSRKDEDDACRVYKIALVKGENMDMHRIEGKPDEDLWINEFELSLVKHKLINSFDGNQQLLLSPSNTREEALEESLRTLGWILVEDKERD